MCIWSFDEARINQTELRPFKLSTFFLQYRVWSLCNQLLLQFSMDSLQTLQTCWDIMKIGMWIFDLAKINFDGIRVI